MSHYISECLQRATNSISELEKNGSKADLLEISDDVWALIMLGGINRFPGQNIFAGLPVKLVNLPQNYIQALDTSSLFTWIIYFNLPDHSDKYFVIEYKGQVPTYESFESAILQKAEDWVSNRASLVGRKDQATQYPRTERDHPNIYCSIM